MASNEKLKALKLTMDKIEKDYGKGSVMMMNEKGVQQIEVIFIYIIFIFFINFTSTFKNF